MHPRVIRTTRHVGRPWLRYAALLLGFACLMDVPAIAQDSTDAGRPNILFIMTDNHAAHALGAYGGRLAALDPTPTLDRLAAEGMRFERAFVSNSICTPSRATLMTGRYSHTNGIKTLNGPLPPERQHLPRLMGEAGYETAMIGKWHLSEEPAAYDAYSVFIGQGNYFNPVLRRSSLGDWPDNTQYLVLLRLRLPPLLRRRHRPLAGVAERARSVAAFFPDAPLQGPARQLRERRAL